MRPPSCACVAHTHSGKFDVDIDRDPNGRFAHPGGPFEAGKTKFKGFKARKLRLLSLPQHEPLPPDSDAEIQRYFRLTSSTAIQLGVVFR